MATTELRGLGLWKAPVQGAADARAPAGAEDTVTPADPTRGALKAAVVGGWVDEEHVSSSLWWCGRD